MDEKYKETVEGEILDAIIIGLEQEKIKEDELPTIADYVITNIDMVRDRNQLIAYLKSLASKWPIFQNVATMEEGKVKRFLEIKMASQALNMLKLGKVNEATNLARKVM